MKKILSCVLVALTLFSIAGVAEARCGGGRRGIVRKFVSVLVHPLRLGKRGGCQ